jgi:hypothetical protein
MDNQNYIIRHADAARRLAFRKHSGMYRRYTGEPYIHHNAEIVGMFYSMYSDYLTEQDMDTCVSIIWLHDVIEDCGVKKEFLEIEFDKEIASGVDWLSDTEVGNREFRKAATRARLARAPAMIQTIKCLDLWSNGTSIILHDPNFAPVFVGEAELLLQQGLTRADAEAQLLVSNLIIAYRATKKKKV